MTEPPINNMVDELTAQLKLTPRPVQCSVSVISTLMTVNEKQGT